jgi:hypothetical protein
MTDSNAEVQVTELQNLGELTQTIRTEDEVGQSGIESLIPEPDGKHTDAMQEIRSVIDEHYGESVERLAGDGEQVVIERLIVPADDLPHIEYTLVDDV